MVKMCAFPECYASYEKNLSGEGHIKLKKKKLKKHNVQTCDPSWDCTGLTGKAIKHIFGIGRGK